MPNDDTRPKPHTRPARVFRTIVMCALATAPAAGCGGGPGGSNEPQPGHVFRGGATGDAGTVEPEPEPAPEDASVEPPGPVEDDGGTGPVPAYGAPYPRPRVSPTDGGGPMPEYAAPVPSRPPATDYGVPDDEPAGLMYMAPQPR